MPEMYGIEHLLYLAISLSITVIGLIFAKRYIKTEKNAEIVVRCLGLILFALIMWNRIAICLYDGGIKEFLPNTYCGATSLAFSFCALFLKRDSKIFHCLVYMAIVGGLATLLYPDFIGQAESIFFSKTISGLLHHSMHLFLALLMLVTGYVKPCIKRWVCLLLGLCVYVTYGIFLVTALGYGNAMYLYEPIIGGTPLTWYFTGALLLIAHAISLAVNAIVKKKHSVSAKMKCKSDGSMAA